MRRKRRQEPKEKTYSERELRKFFSMQSELKDRIEKVARICTNITSREDVTGFWFDEDTEDPGVGIGVWSQDCGNDQYWFPLEFLTMTLDEVESAMEKRKRRR